jgi:hypothetical protein
LLAHKLQGYAETLARLTAELDAAADKKPVSVKELRYISAGLFATQNAMEVTVRQIDNALLEDSEDTIIDVSDDDTHSEGSYARARIAAARAEKIEELEAAEKAARPEVVEAPLDAAIRVAAAARDALAEQVQVRVDELKAARPASDVAEAPVDAAMRVAVAARDVLAGAGVEMPALEPVFAEPPARKKARTVRPTLDWTAWDKCSCIDECAMSCDCDCHEYNPHQEMTDTACCCVDHEYIVYGSGDVPVCTVHCLTCSMRTYVWAKACAPKRAWRCTRCRGGSFQCLDVDPAECLIFQGKGT